MVLSRYGEIIQKWWSDIPIHFLNVETEVFVIMPNHIHGIIIIDDHRGEALCVSPRILPNQNVQPRAGKPTLGQVIGYFKYQSTKEMNALDDNGVITKFWQRNYYERIIRNEKELKQKTEYILGNLSRWDDDTENP